MKITYDSIRQLNLLPKEMLITTEEVAIVAKALSTNSGTTVTVDNIVDHLLTNQFYLPRLTYFNDAIGIFLNNKFLALPCNFEYEDKEEIEGSENIRVILTLEAISDSLSISTTIKPGVSSKKLMSVFYDLITVDEDGSPQVNQKVVDELIAMLVPAITASLPEGTYQVKTVTSKDRTVELTLEDGMKVTVNRGTPSDVKTIKSINGALYQVVDGRVVRGISVTGMASKLILGDSENDVKVGDSFDVIAVSVNNAGTGDYYIAKLAKEGESPLESKWYNVEGNLASLATRFLDTGKYPNVTVTSIKPKTGKMASPKPIFSLS